MPYAVPGGGTAVVQITCPRCGESYPATGQGWHVCPNSPPSPMTYFPISGDTK